LHHSFPPVYLLPPFPRPAYFFLPIRSPLIQFFTGGLRWGFASFFPYFEHLNSRPSWARLPIVPALSFPSEGSVQGSSFYAPPLETDDERSLFFLCCGKFFSDFFNLSHNLFVSVIAVQNARV